VKKFPDDLLPRDDCSFLGSPHELGSGVFQIMSLSPEKRPINLIFCGRRFERADGTVEAFLSLADVKVLSSLPVFVAEGRKARPAKARSGIVWWRSRLN
jgi:hypothetical protein